MEKKLTFEFDIERSQIYKLSLNRWRPLFRWERFSVLVADVFLEQSKSLRTDFNGRIAQNCWVSYTKINDELGTTVQLSPLALSRLLRNIYVV